MNSDQPFRELEVVSSLMELARSTRDELGRSATLSFNYSPNLIGVYGIEGSQWQAVLVDSNVSILDYGRTIEEAGGRLLDRLLHPEKYQDAAD